MIAVHVNDPAWSDYTDFKQLPGHIVREIQRFFEDYKQLESKQVEVASVRNAKAAVKVVVEALDLYRKEEQQLRGWK